MKIEIYITVEGKNENGELEYFDHRKANSPVMGFIDMICVFAGQQALQIIDTAGNTNAIGVYATNISMMAGVNTATYGIRVGTSTQAVSLTDTGLISFIGHGTGSGQLVHGANSVGTPITSGTSRQFTVSRTFTNNYSGAITVNEVGIIVRAGSSNFNVLIDRTLNTFTINPTKSRTVTYTVKVTV